MLNKNRKRNGLPSPTNTICSCSSASTSEEQGGRGEQGDRDFEQGLSEISKGVSTMSFAFGASRGSAAPKPPIGWGGTRLSQTTETGGINTTPAATQSSSIFATATPAPTATKGQPPASALASNTGVAPTQTPTSPFGSPFGQSPSQTQSNASANTNANTNKPPGQGQCPFGSSPSQPSVFSRSFTFSSFGVPETQQAGTFTFGAPTTQQAETSMFCESAAPAPANNARAVFGFGSPSKDADYTSSFTHVGISCDCCKIKSIKGVRYRCSVCANYDLCQGCMERKEKFEAGVGGGVNPVHCLDHLFYRIGKPNPNHSTLPIVMNRSGFKHTGTKCTQCNEVDPSGYIYKCQMCPNCTLCESCEAKGLHNLQHPRTKILQPSLEAEELAKCRAELELVKRKLQQKHFYEKNTMGW